MLIALTTLLFFASIAWAALREWERPHLFYLWFGLAETGVLGAFMAQDLALFVVFFDLMLVPFCFLGGGWGEHASRVASMIKLVIYTLVGSLLMLAAAIATGVLAPGDTITFDLVQLGSQARRLATGSQEWIFLFFAAAFLVKMPAFPLHGWMPDGYKAMPLPVLAVFSGVLSKVAAYGFLRVVLPMYPDASAHFQELMLLISLASILYGSVMAFTTPDSRLVARLLVGGPAGLHHAGDLLPAGHAARRARCCRWSTTGSWWRPLFFIVALLAARAGGSEDIREMGGIAFRAPVLATLFLIVALANAGDAGLVELRRRVPDPARRLQGQDRHRDRRLHRRGAGQRLHAAPVHPRDAQPRRSARGLARDRARATGSCSCRWWR